MGDTEHQGRPRLPGGSRFKGKVLVVLGPSDGEAYKSFRNLPAVQLLMANELNAYDILCNDWIVFTRDTLPGEVTVVEALSEAAGPTGPAATEPTSERPPTEAEPEMAAAATANAGVEQAALETAGRRGRPPKRRHGVEPAGEDLAAAPAVDDGEDGDE